MARSPAIDAAVQMPVSSSRLRAMRWGEPLIYTQLQLESHHEDTMKLIATFLLLSLSLAAHAEDKKPTTLRGVLLAQLRTTHNQKDWFVPVNVAVEGLTAEQATWTDWARQSLHRAARESPAVLEHRPTGSLQGRDPAKVQRRQQRNLQQLWRQELDGDGSQDRPSPERLGE